MCKHIPRNMTLQTVSFGFKDTGQPPQCFKCSSLEHIIKDCPLKRAKTPQTDNTENSAATTTETLTETAPATLPDTHRNHENSRNDSQRSATWRLQAPTTLHRPNHPNALIHRQRNPQNGSRNFWPPSRHPAENGLPSWKPSMATSSTQHGVYIYSINSATTLTRKHKNIMGINPRRLWHGNPSTGWLPRTPPSLNYSS